MDQLFGVRLIATPLLVDKETRIVQRSWRERLFSLPWQPLRPWKEVVTTVPAKKALVMEDGTWYMHPTTLEQLRKKLSECKE